MKPDKRRERTPDGGVKIFLDDPIKWGNGEPVTSLVLRRPKAKDMRQFGSKVNVGKLLDFAAKLAGEPPSMLDELSVSDMDRVLDEVKNFFPDGQKIGKAR